MTARVLMLQGTGSNVGKSILTAAFCRLARRRGLSVAPFKPQNMSNNAAACADGGEIGRAQALQARAAGVEPCVDHNPVLLKPETDRAAQLVVQGRAVGRETARDYMSRRNRLMPCILESFGRLCDNHDLVLVEGAGSPAETNLRARDIANMGFARHVGAPVILIGDIDRGGVIAAIIGTQSVLAPEDAKMIRGVLINKFRGDPDLFDDGVRAIETQTAWPCFGVVPWIQEAAALPAEDAVSIEGAVPSDGRALTMVAPMLSRIANFDDADPFRLEPCVRFQWIAPGAPIPRTADIVILFGTKSTRGDLDFLRMQGWDHDIIAHARTGGRVLGICGGYQMLGRTVRDPKGVDGPAGEAPGLGLLNVETRMKGPKTVRPTRGRCAVSNAPFTGYEIHMGTTEGPDTNRPMLHAANGPDGARSADGRIEGTYVHGAFASDDIRTAWLNRVRAGSGSSFAYEAAVESAIDSLADQVARAVDLDRIFAVAATPTPS